MTYGYGLNRMNWWFNAASFDWTAATDRLTLARSLNVPHVRSRLNKSKAIKLAAIIPMGCCPVLSRDLYHRRMGLRCLVVSVETYAQT